MAGRVLALVHREGLLLWVQEVAHVLVGGLDAVGGAWVVWGLFVFSAVVQHCYVIQLMLAFSANPVL